MPPRAAIGRRGFLGALAALGTAAGLATAGARSAPPAALPAAPLARENARLIRLGDYLAAIDAALSAAVTRRDEARQLALASWPAPPAGIVWDTSRQVPHWCGVHSERDLDDRDVYANGENRPPRKVADPHQLAVYVQMADGRTRDAKAAKRALALAEGYEGARELVLISSGYAAARDAVRTAEYRMERVAELIHKNQHRTAAGLAIKAQAVIAITSRPGIHPDIAFRHKLMHAQKLAQGIVELQGGIGRPSTGST